MIPADITFLAEQENRYGFLAGLVILRIFLVFMATKVVENSLEDSVFLCSKISGYLKE